MSDQSSSAFRASDWIEYAPDKQLRSKLTNSSNNNNNKINNTMDHDVDMDAPQISTLRDDTSPPPPPQQAHHSRTPSSQAPPTQGGRVSKFRVKLKVTEPSARASADAPAPASESAGTAARGRAATGQDSQDEGTQDSPDSEEEWDQLADDDDIAPPSSSVIGTPARSAHHPSASSTPVRGGRGAGGRGGRGRGRGRGRGGAATVSAAEPPQTIFEIAPSVAHVEHGAHGMLDTGSAGTGSPSPSKGPRKRARKLQTDTDKKKPGRRPRASKVMQLQDDAASVASESFVGTASSSPFVRGGEFSTPELEPVPLNVNLPPSAIQPLPPSVSDNSIPHEPSSHAADGAPVPGGQQQHQQQPQQFTLDPSVPIPVYRLPSKPFLVQPPPKISNGFAPAIPLDRGPAARAPVRRWRPALRAIRGITGGQWFVKTWVGEKESAYATVTGRDQENAPPHQAFGSVAHGHEHLGRGRGRGSASASPALSVTKLPPAPALSALGGSGASGGGPGTRTPGRSKLSQSQNPSQGGTGAASTAASSRAGSAAAEGGASSNTPVPVSSPGELIAPHPTGMRPLSKMRHTVSAEEAEMAVDETL